MKILYTYISRQFLKNFLLLISIFTLIVISSQMLHLPKFVYSMNLLDFGSILLLLNLSFAKLQLLFGFFIAWLLVGIKLKESNEIYAIYSLGVKKSDIIKPAVVWSVIFAILGVIFSSVISPYANRERAKFLTVKVKSYLLDTIQPQAFSKVSENIYIYVDKKEDNRFNKIIIQNLTNGFIITAKSGYFKENFVVLENGYIQIPAQDSYSIMSFKRYSFNIDITYLKEIAIEDLKSTELIKMIINNEPTKNKVISILSDRFMFPLPFLFIGVIGFLTGLSVYRAKEHLLAALVLSGIFYVVLNHLFIKLIEKAPLLTVIYPAILIAILGFVSIKLYKIR